MRTHLALLFTALSVASFALLAPAVAHADESAPPPAERTAPEATSTWYGYQTLATDGAALSMGLGSVASGASRSATVFGAAGLGTYALGGPIVHFAHGEVSRGFVDLGIRAAAPLVLGVGGGIIGGRTAPSSNDADKSLANGYVGVTQGATIGALVGAITASAIDAIFLAHDERPAQARPAPAAARMSPDVNVAREAQGGGRATVGVTGTF